MGNEITYDNASSAELITPKQSSEGPQAIQGEPSDIGCHSNSTQISALANNKNAEILEKYAEDYPVGPHDKPQSCLLYTSPSPRDLSTSRMPSSA